MSTEEMTARGPGADAAFSLRGVTRRFGDVVAVDDLWLDIEEGEFFSLLGPSGCGKTTTLRMLAGFEEPDEGTILLRGDDVTFTPPNRRNVNLVFQHYELFPHMTVFENVAYGLKLRKVREPELGERVREALAIVRVADLSERGARQLSGGQQQRVALARAIVNRPAVLLLDEPLSALDVKLRKQMQLELKGIQAQLGTTFVYVTHDQEEALLMSDRIGVMVGGRLLQVAPPREIYDHPSDDFVADFIGSLNVLTGTLEALDGGVGRARAIAVDAAAAPGRLAFAAPGPAGPGVGEEIHIAVRPERIELLPADAALAEMTNDTWLPGRIEQIDYLGSLTRVMVSSPGQADVVCQRTSDGSTDKFRAGTSVVMSWPPDAAFVLPGQADTTTSDDRA